MRTTLSSAAIAIITGASHPALASADKKEDRAVANAVISLTRDVNKSYQSSKLQRPRSLLGGEECNSFNDHGPNASENSAYGYVDIDVDVGILGCRADDEICVRDETSSLGGRCTLASAASSLYSSGEQQEEEQERPQKPLMAAFPNRRNRRLPSNRRLQPAIGGAEEEEEEVDGPFVCPTNCPKDFCDCAQDDGDASACAAELNAVCTAGLIAECVPDKYLDFYTQTYCPYAKCVAVYNKPLEECSCDYYRDYCQVYYEFVESMDKCEVGECCAVQPAGSKWTCIPEMQPTLNPTGSPTSSAKPSASPTVSLNAGGICVIGILQPFFHLICCFFCKFDISYRSLPSRLFLSHRPSLLLLRQNRPSPFPPLLRQNRLPVRLVIRRRVQRRALL